MTKRQHIIRTFLRTATVTGLVTLLFLGVLWNCVIRREATFYGPFCVIGNGPVPMSPIDNEQRSYFMGQLAHVKTTMKNGTVQELGWLPDSLYWSIAISVLMGLLVGVIMIVIKPMMMKLPQREVAMIRTSPPPA